MAKPYGLDCPVARTLDVIGDRWTILLLRRPVLIALGAFRIFPRRFRG